MTSLYGFEAIQLLTKMIDDSFPSMTHAICYGSKAFPQTLKKEKSTNGEGDSFIDRLNAPMIDFIFIVDDSQKWHSQNLSTNNYYHYSMLTRPFGASFISYFQGIGPGVFYNPFVNMNNYNLMIKYGVITTSQLMRDLVYWDHLYIAGRLQKPTIFLKQGQSTNYENDCLENIHRLSEENQIDFADFEHFNCAMQLNLDYALRVALILLLCEDKGSFTLKELFVKITSLSYCGDNRNRVSEDVHKFEKIVNGSYDAFIELYGMLLPQYIRSKKDDDAVYVVADGVDIRFLCNRLPRNLSSAMTEFDGNIFLNLNDTQRVKICIYNALCGIVGSSSWTQTIKGIVTAGFANSIWYLLRKISKYYTSTKITT